MKSRRLLTVLLAVFLIGVTSCKGGGTTTLLPTSVAVKDGTELVERVNIETAETLQLRAVVAPEGSKQTVTWEVSDTAVATISETGLLTGVSKGDAVVTVASTELTYISQQIFVHVHEPVVQTGVGSGKSSHDPIFLGNEGEDEPLEVYFLETYHIYADSIYLKKGNVDVIIDAGWKYDGEMNNAFIKEKVTDGKIDLLVATHSHEDHYDGIRGLIDGINDVSVVLDYGTTAANPDYKQLVSELVADGSEYYPAIDCVKEENGAVGRFYLTSEFYVEILNTGAYISGGAGGAENQASLALMFYYRDFKFFTAGDLTSNSEVSLMKNEDLPRVTLYKASHHASTGSNIQPLLNKLDPKFVAISASRAGTYNQSPSAPREDRTYNLSGTAGHPHEDAVGRIYQAPRIKQNLNVYWNMPSGTMSFTTDGEDDCMFKGSETRLGYHDLTVTNGNPVWNPMISNFENKVTGEENKKFHETKVFEFRNYGGLLPK